MHFQDILSWLGQGKKLIIDAWTGKYVQQLRSTMYTLKSFELFKKE